MFGRDADRRNMPSKIRFDQSDDETDHRPIGGVGLIAEGFGRGQQVVEGLAAISFAVGEAALVESPTLFELGDGQRADDVGPFWIEGRSRRLLCLIHLPPA